MYIPLLMTRVQMIKVDFKIPFRKRLAMSMAKIKTRAKTKWKNFIPLAGTEKIRFMIVGKIVTAIRIKIVATTCLENSFCNLAKRPVTLIKVSITPPI